MDKSLLSKLLLSVFFSMSISTVGAMEMGVVKDSGYHPENVMDGHRHVEYARALTTLRTSDERINITLDRQATPQSFFERLKRLFEAGHLNEEARKKRDPLALFLIHDEAEGFTYEQLWERIAPLSLQWLSLAENYFTDGASFDQAVDLIEAYFKSWRQKHPEYDKHQREDDLRDLCRAKYHRNRELMRIEYSHQLAIIEAGEQYYQSPKDSNEKIREVEAQYNKRLAQLKEDREQARRGVEERYLAVKQCIEERAHEKGKGRVIKQNQAEQTEITRNLREPNQKSRRIQDLINLFSQPRPAAPAQARTNIQAELRAALQARAANGQPQPRGGTQLQGRTDAQPRAGRQNAQPHQNPVRPNAHSQQAQNGNKRIRLGW